jgi:hypothetical protein
MKSPVPEKSETYREQAEQLYGVTDDASRRRVIRQCLIAPAWIVTIIPLIFYLRFGEVGPLGWGLTVFFIVYVLLTAIGLFFSDKKEFHTQVEVRRDWLDRVGAFWLVACAFGPLLGWILTSGVIPVTDATWRWLYGGRVLCATLLPVLTALPLTRYLDGNSVMIGLPILVFVTLLPILTAVNAGRDLWEGPRIQKNLTGATERVLKHTRRRLSAAP